MVHYICSLTHEFLVQLVFLHKIKRESPIGSESPVIVLFRSEARMLNGLPLLRRICCTNFVSLKATTSIRRLCKSFLRSLFLPSLQLQFVYTFGNASIGVSALHFCSTVNLIFYRQGVAISNSAFTCHSSLSGPCAALR